VGDRHADHMAQGLALASPTGGDHSVGVVGHICIYILKLLGLSARAKNTDREPPLVGEVSPKFCG
jgi:hypothetical protein